MAIGFMLPFLAIFVTTSLIFRKNRIKSGKGTQSSWQNLEKFLANKRAFLANTCEFLASLYKLPGKSSEKFLANP